MRDHTGHSCGKGGDGSGAAGVGVMQWLDDGGDAVVG